MVIEVVSRQRLARVDKEEVARLASAAIEAVRHEGAQMTVAFVRDRRMRALNREFRGKDRATDVLSFPAGDAFDERGRYLGDVVISIDTAMRQAGDTGHKLEREISELLIHGVLHLCGYDHETDQGEMNRLELRLRRKLLDSGQ
ncbi:MAG TPA: rRNA maturation RNase YbeY [Blastocatellia bacterium]